MTDGPVPQLETTTLIRGDSRSWVDTFEENVGTPEAPVWQAMNLSDYTWLCQVRGNLNRGTVIATIAVDTTNAATGVLVRQLTADQADLLPGQTAPPAKPVVYFDLEGTRTSDGFRRTFKRYLATVEGDSSHA